MRIGIVGTGRMGGIFAAALAELDDVDLSIAGSRPGRADALAAATGARAADDPAGLIGSVDAVVVAAASPAHPALLRLGIEAGIPLFCEKPLALDLAATDEIIKAAAAAGVEIQVGFQRRFDPDVAATRAAVESGAIGDVYLVRLAGHDRLPGDPEFIAESGGMERDLLIHDFDLVAFVTGRPVTGVLAMHGAGGFPDLAAYDEHGDVGVAAAILAIDGGALGVVTGLRHHPAGHDVRLEVHGSKGAHAAGWDPKSPLRPEPGPRHQSFPDRFAAAYAAEMHAFVEMAAGKRPNPVPAVAARRALAVAMAAERSRLEGRPVPVAEIG